MVVPASPSTGHEPPLLLLVEDHEDTREMYAEHLRFSGYRVITATGVRECVELARSRHPALILLDIRMVPTTGTEAVRALRKDDTLSDIHIIALTAYAPDQQRKNALAEGFDAVIEKPCLPDDLRATVDRLVARPRSPA